MLRIFISSTSKDLLTHREAVRQAVNGLKMHPIMQEDMNATDDNAVEKCRREVLECDIFIGIYAHRYGSIPPGQTKSITELEYDWATTAHKPRLIYVVDPAYAWDSALRDPDPTAVECFKKRVGLERVWKTFTTPESLEAAVARGLAEIEKPTIVKAQRRQLTFSVIGVGILLFLLFAGLVFVLQQQQAALKPTPTITPTSIATAITEGTDREVLVVLTKFDQMGGSEDDPASAWERTMQKPMRELKTVKARVARYDKVIRGEEEAKALAKQLKATIVIWGWTYGSDSAGATLTTNYTIAPQWSDVLTQLDETQIQSVPDQSIGVTIAKGADTEYVLNFVLAQLEYFGTERRDAMPYLDRAIEKAPMGREKAMGLAAIYFYRGWIYQALDKKLDEALSDYSKAIQLNPNYAIAYTNRGIVYTDQKQYDKALKDLDKAILLDPTDADPYNNRGNVYTRQHEYDKALEDYNKAIHLYPIDPQPYVNLGVVYSDQKQYGKALENFDKAIQLNPNLAEAYTDRGAVYADQQQYDKALEDYNKAIQLNPAYAMTYYNRGILYYLRQRYDDALKDFDKAIQLNPNYAEAFNNRGVIYADRNQYDKALENYNEAIQLDPENADAYSNRGVVYIWQQRYDDALKEFAQALQIDPNFSTAYLRRGVLYIWQQRYDDALADFDRAIQLNPNLALAYYYQGQVYKTLRRYDEALTDFREYVKLAPDDPKGSNAIKEIESLLESLTPTPTK